MPGSITASMSGTTKIRGPDVTGAGENNSMALEGGSDVDAAFEAHVGPVRDALLRLLDASDELQGTWGSMAAADSQAMAELAAEDQFQGETPWGTDPVLQAHNFAQLLLFGANDCARALARLLSSETTPVYAHTVLARASLEHAGRAWWLLDTAIGVRLRIARGVNERIFGLAQQDRLPITKADKRRARERRTALYAEGERLGFRKVRPNRNVLATLEEPRPGQTAIIRELLRTGEDAELGVVLYGLFSAVAHGTTFGLTHSVTLDAPGMPTVPGVTWGAVYTGSWDVVSVLAAVILGIGKAYHARNKFFNWSSVAWNGVYVEAIRATKQALPGDPGRG